MRSYEADMAVQVHTGLVVCVLRAARQGTEDLWRAAVASRPCMWSVGWWSG